jgi:pre-mRNA-processing factor 40
VAPGGFGAAGGPSTASGGQSSLGANLSLNIPMRNGVPYFQTQAEAEQAFMSMLKAVGVTADWNWERVMRETVTEPLYKALKTLSERKTAFEKYVIESKREEQEEQERSLERCRKDWFKAMDKLGGGPTMESGVKTWWSWDRGRRELEAKFPETFKGPRNDKERETLFFEYIDALKKKEEVRSGREFGERRGGGR